MYDVASTDEAPARLVVDSCALVITGMMMPDRSGIELLREITSDHPDTVVIIVLARASKAFLQRTRDRFCEEVARQKVNGAV